MTYHLVYTCRNHGYEQYWDGCRWTDDKSQAVGYTLAEAEVMRKHFTCYNKISIKKGE